MEIRITQKAADWFKEEMDAERGEAVRFFARYGGSSPLHEGFSLGVTKEQPDEAAVEAETDGIRFYIESRDVWYFDSHDLHVDVDDTMGELKFGYVRS
ncbi:MULTISPECIES: HesB/YadR/YfhF family protein [Sporosarcina]|uniref:HesB/YadR/YfhF family protein n=1 Tax=Sporosarcina TaxID=1569 RepID=UPI00058D965F|nr:MULTISPECIES: HesB/YadR/YfhF family protein [Sporosarcina]WJY28330.1 HesB/YadR/YfhF family protein [Sporosarcina sp. 0.2-SM1T-5]